MICTQQLCAGEALLAQGGSRKITCEGEIEETREKGEDKAGVSRQQESCSSMSNGNLSQCPILLEIYLP